MELLLLQPEEAEMVICKGHRLRENRNWDHGSRDQSWPPGPLPAPSPLFTSWEPTPVRLWAPRWRDLAGCAPGSFSLTHTWHTLGLEVWACPSIKADSDGKKVWPSPPTRSLRESCTAGWFAEASAGRWFEKFLELNTTIDSGIWKTLPTPQEEKQPLTTSKAPTFVAGVVMPAEWSRRSISPFFPWHRVSKNARLPQPGWRMSWAPGWDLSPRHPLPGLQQGLQLEGGGGFPHAQREELLRLSTNWECESARMSGDGQALCHGLQIQMYTHTHTHCLGSTSWQCHQTTPTVSPLSWSQSIFLQSGDTADTLASECPARRTHGTPCWTLSFPLLSGFAPTATYPLSTPSSGSSPVSPLDSSLSHHRDLVFPV